MTLQESGNWSDLWLYYGEGMTPGSTRLNPDFLTLLKPGDYILDVGCGPGRNSLELATTGRRVIGIDVNPREIDYARREVMSQNPNIDFQVMSGEEMNFKDNEFDATVLLGTLGGVQRELRGRILRETVRVVKPGGIIYIGELARKHGDPKRDAKYARDEALAGEPGARVVHEFPGRRGRVKFIAKHFEPDEVRQMMDAVGLVDVVLVVDTIEKRNVTISGPIEMRDQISAWGRKP
jgi:ubiquinone/menaquinone biosynthesis C-methylase UbiE